MSSEPVERSWELSLYELHRTPQEAVTDDDTEIAVSARSLQSELTCPICLDMLTQTMTTKECLHRFCAECIVTALRSGNKECPTCRKKLVSKRSLRPDPNFDRLVEKIFPNREEYDAHQDSILESLSRSHSQNFITSITDGIKAQMAHAKAANRKSKGNNHYDETPDSPHHTPIIGGPGSGRRGGAGGDSDDDEADGAGGPPASASGKKKKKMRPPTAILASGASSSAGAGLATGDGGEVSDSSASSGQEVEIVFRLHPSMNETNSDLVEAIQGLSTRFIKTTSVSQVEHLCKYLAMRISLDMPSPKKEGMGAPTQPLPPPSSSSSAPQHGSVKDLVIYIVPSPGQIVQLSMPMTLAQVAEKYWKVNKPMEMLYSFQRKT